MYMDTIIFLSASFPREIVQLIQQITAELCNCCICTADRGKPVRDQLRSLRRKEPNFHDFWKSIIFPNSSRHNAHTLTHINFTPAGDQFLTGFSFRLRYFICRPRGPRRRKKGEPGTVLVYMLYYVLPGTTAYPCCLVQSI